MVALTSASAFSSGTQWLARSIVWEVTSFATSRISPLGEGCEHAGPTGQRQHRHNQLPSRSRSAWSSYPARILFPPLHIQSRDRARRTWIKPASDKPILSKNALRWRSESAQLLRLAYAVQLAANFAITDVRGEIRGLASYQTAIELTPACLTAIE